MTPRIRIRRLLMRLMRRPTRPKFLVYLSWGDSDLETEMVALDFIPSVGDDIEIELRDVADDPKRWSMVPKTVSGKVTGVKHWIQINYGNDVGPNSLQSATVQMLVRGEW